MKTKGLILFSIIAVIISSCSEAEKGPVSISGTVTGGGNGQELFLEQLTPMEVVALDTTVIAEDGSFSFDHQISEIGFYRVKQSDKKFIIMISNADEIVKIDANWEIGITPYKVTGSPETERLMRLNQHASGLFRKKDSLNQVYQANQGDVDILQKLQEEFMFYNEKHAAFVREFVDENPGSFACLAAAEQLDPDTDFEYYQKIDQGLAANFGNTNYYTEFHKLIERMNLLSVGSEAPDILLPNAEGEVVPLSSLRGKVVLVDFWASWCKPCRAENPNVVRAYEKFKSKGFEVYGVSLDKDRAAWVAAIDQDDLHWTQVSDLQFWNSAVVKLYDITGIPFALLLDQEGKIIAKNLRGKQLDDKLEEILN